MKTCQACSMPLTKPEECAGGNIEADFCLYCTNPDGSVKSCQEIFDGGVNYFIGVLNGDKLLAERITRKNMLSLPYWQGKDCDCFKGDVASDEEFADTMSQLAD